MTEDYENFDRTAEGKATVALLERHAPTPPDVRAATVSILAALPEQPAPKGQVLVMRWAAAGVATAAALMLAVLLVLPSPQPLAPTDTADRPHEDTGDALIEDAPQPAPRFMAPADVPELAVTVRGRSGDGWRIDAGLARGVRVGDVFEGPGGVDAKVVAVGIFDARVVCGTELALGTRLYTDAGSDPLLRAEQHRLSGGDPGALFDLGAVFDILPLAQARDLGIGDGRALVVVEVIPAILRNHATDPEPSLAARLGLQRGDVLLEVNGVPATDMNALVQALQWTRGSGALSATVLRQGRTIGLEHP